MTVPNPLPPHDWHAPIIAAIINAYGRYTKEPRYLEIGVDRGHTLWHIFSQTDAHIDGVDITFDNYQHGKHSRITFWEETSDDFFTGEFTSKSKYDVIFIDGDHMADQVWKDIRNALKVLNTDGTILVHDTLPKFPEVATEQYCGDGFQAIHALMQGQPDVLQVWTLPLFPGLTLISKDYVPIGPMIR